MDGNSAKKVPVLDPLVSTHNTPNKQAAPIPPTPIAANPLLSSTDGNTSNLGDSSQLDNPLINQEANKPQTKPQTKPQAGNVPQDRHTDKSQFEIELANTVNQIMLKHFEHASEQIVQQVLSEVRARLPGQRKT